MPELKILFIEDSENDSLLLVRELQSAGYDVQWQRVETRASLQAALSGQAWDLILCDYVLPAMTVIEALEIVKGSGLDLPMILLSGRVGEEHAIGALKAGAHDFISKNNTTRLVPAIERELKQVQDQRRHKQVDDILQASELRFRSTLETMMEGCQIIGYDWRYLFLNDAAVRHSRKTREELIGRTMMECYPNIEDTAMFLALRSCMQERTSHRMVSEFIYPDGKKGWFELSIQPSPDGLFILSTDITVHKQVEASLLEREMKLTTLFEILPLGISILDAERRVIYTNPALKRILDLSEEELRHGTYANRKYLKSDGTLMRSDEMASVQALKTGREITAMDTGVVKEDGSIVWISVSAMPVNFTDWKLVVVTADITERHKMEEVRSYMAAIIDSTSDAIISKDLNGIITSWNPGAQRIFGYSGAEIIGQPIQRLIPADRVQEEREILEQITAGNIVADFETIRVTRDGSAVHVSLTVSPIKNTSGQVVGASKLARDITERKQAEIEIKKLNIELEQKVAQRTAELAAANEQLYKLSLFDELTGLYNRRGFLLLAEQQLMQAQRTKHSLLIFYADIDDLKHINDRHGHAAGDDAIVAAAQAIQEAFRGSDIKARLGGDEFIVMVVAAGELDGSILLARLQEKLVEKRLSMSVGMAAVNAHDPLQIDQLITRADQAMYTEKRKKSGRAP